MEGTKPIFWYHFVQQGQSQGLYISVEGCMPRLKVRGLVSFVYFNRQLMFQYNIRVLLWLIIVLASLAAGSFSCFGIVKSRYWASFVTLPTMVTAEASKWLSHSSIHATYRYFLLGKYFPSVLNNCFQILHRLPMDVRQWYTLWRQWTENYRHWVKNKHSSC